ncbi:MAG: hypothetical protein MUC57_19170 [Desulfobacterales bacterium]|nr:hypothetical protein [Desulfobacterales bacterium]
MYEFVTGPLAWLAFAVFFIGNIVRLVFYVRGLDWKLDRVTYSVNTSFGVKGAVRSVLFWLAPFGTHSWRDNPWFTILVFVMHVGLIFTPEVRIITNAYDYLMLAIAVAPFVTGLIARYAFVHSEPWLIVHVLSGELFLIAIPLTKLSHFVLFFATRAQLGMDYGIKRGGMKSSGINW